MTSPVQSYMSEFIRNANLHQKQGTDGVENLLKRSLSLLNGIQNLEEFRPESLECCQFYISIYEILKKLDFKSGSDLGAECLMVLQKATKNLDARQALLQQYRFVPLLAKLLEDATNKEIIVLLLTTIQDLSYGIQITWQEPYLTGLIQKLVEYIYGEEVSLGSLALSVLINICYKNLPVIYLLLRITRASTFTKKIQPYGILAYKMLIIIDFVDSPVISNMKKFIKKSFMDISDCFQTCNVPYLKHIVDFLTDARNNRSMQMIFKDYNDLNADVENLLTKIASKTVMQNGSAGDGNGKNVAQCYALIFVLLESFLRADSTLSGVIPKIFDLAVVWVECTQSSAKALELMRTIVTKVDDGHVQMIIKELEKILPNMLYNIEKNNVPSEQIIALFNLLIILLRNTKFQTVVLSTFTESYFDKMFSPLINTNPELLNYAKFSNDDLAKFLLCLQVLIEFSNIAPNVWRSKVALLFGTKQIHYVIAKGVLCKNENLCQVVFEMAKTSNFPRDDVAKITSKLSPLITANNSKSNCDSNSKFSNDTIRNEKVWINNGLEERLDSLIVHIFEANERSEYNNVATSELIELFHYKINLCNSTEQNLVKNLGDASEEITNLSHRINLLGHEMSEYYSMNFKLHLTQERLQSENMNYLKQQDSLKESSAELVKKIESERKKYQSYMVSLESKKVEAEELHKEIEMYRKKETITNAELRKYETDIRDASARIEQLKKSIHLLEETNKEKRKIVESCKKEQQKSIKTIEELRESNMKSENLIKHLEKQLSVKNEKIRSYEAELLETEEMRKTILSLMESKRPKRDS